MSESQRKMPVSETTLTTKVHDHDVRLARLETRMETELSGIHAEMRTQRDDIRANRKLTETIQSDLGDMGRSVGSIMGQNKAIMWILGLSAVLFGGLELWVVFR